MSWRRIAFIACLTGLGVCFVLLTLIWWVILGGEQ